MLLYGIALTVFVSSALLFWAQPMFSKMMLPVFGGVPSVWNTCLFFYQGTLFIGYGYVHLTSKWLHIRQQIIVHIVLVWAIFSMMSFDFSVAISAQHWPILWLLRSYLHSIGLPFLMLSATTPLLQWWFSQTNHPDAAHPYFLYAVSNLGSLLALLSYPFIVEPSLSLHDQNIGWQAGYGILTILLVVCAVFIQPFTSRQSLLTPQAPPAERVSWQHRLRWLAASCIPSSLLLGVTAHITTDIAAVPLLWILPLGLYLLTFVLVFAKNPPLRYERMLRLQTYLVFPLLLLSLGELRTRLWLDLPLHLFAFTIFTMVCHGELAKSKPSPARLTEFYVWMAAGGFLGGMFSVLLAPLIFDRIFEYPLMIGLACLVRPVGFSGFPRQGIRRILLSLLILLTAMPLGLIASPNRESVVLIGILSLMVITSIGGAFWFQALTTPTRCAAGVGSFMLIIFLLASQQHVRMRTRTFFGALKITESPESPLRRFYHGTTLHGAQRIQAEQRPEALAYYHQVGPLGQLFQHLRDKPPRSIAVIGLGVGTIAAYNRPQDRMTFYEIDAQVEHIARDTNWFRYLETSLGKIQVILGDARISLTQDLDQTYDIIIEDAFSSDTIPMHLLTREAFRLYQSRLTEEGLLVFHITNRYLHLERVLAGLIDDSGMSGLIQRDTDVSPKAQEAGQYPSVWVIAARKKDDLASWYADSRWKPLQPQPGFRLWTDNYSNILDVLK